MYTIKYSKQACKDKDNLRGTALYNKAKELIAILRENPYQSPPTYEKLVGNLAGLFSRRINRQHRIWYSIDADAKIVRILRMWSHYE